jgi:hypothetical protein
LEDKRDLADMIKVMDHEIGIILGYSGELNLLHESSKQTTFLDVFSREISMTISCFKFRKRARTQNMHSLPKALQGRVMDSYLEPLGMNATLQTLDFRLVRPVLDF